MDAHRERLQTQLNGLSHGVAGLRTRLSNLIDHLLVTATENQTFLKKTITNLLTGTKFRGSFAPLTTIDDDPIEDCMSGYGKPPSERATYTEEFVEETNCTIISSPCTYFFFSIGVRLTTNSHLYVLIFSIYQHCFLFALTVSLYLHCIVFCLFCAQWHYLVVACDNCNYLLHIVIVPFSGLVSILI